MDLLIVLQELSKGYTCVAYSGETLYTSTQRGVAPLLNWLEEDLSLETFQVADKVVGKGAAFLYLLLGAKRIYAAVISVPALNVLKSHGVAVTFTTLVPAIQNRDHTGFCPIETAVLDCESPEEALIKIKKRLQELKK